MGIKKSRLLNRILMYTLNIFLAVVFLAPLVWMMVSSVKPEVNIFADMTSVRAFLPISGSLDNYFHPDDLRRFGAEAKVSYQDERGDRENNA